MHFQDDAYSMATDSHTFKEPNQNTVLHEFA